MGVVVGVRGNTAGHLGPDLPVCKTHKHGIHGEIFRSDTADTVFEPQVASVEYKMIERGASRSSNRLLTHLRSLRCAVPFRTSIDN